MNEFEVLRLGVEISVALAGFAGIITTFQFSGTLLVRRGPVAALTIIVQLSLLAALSASIPIVLNSFGMEGATLWTVCSTYGVICYVAQMYITNKNLRGSFRKKSALIIFWLIQSACAFGVLANILNALNLVFHREPGPYIAVVFIGVSIAGYMFSRLLTLPLWRAVRKYEASQIEDISKD